MKPLPMANDKDVCFNLHFRKEALEDILDILLKLPEPFRPTKFSHYERQVRNKEDLIANKKRFEKFKEDNPLGYFLFAPKCKYNISNYSKSPLEVDVYRTRGKEDFKKTEEILKNLASEKTIFGFLCSRAELKNRNYCYIDLRDVPGSKFTSISGFIGRDLGKYIPGVYWVTIVSGELLEKHVQS